MPSSSLPPRRISSVVTTPSASPSSISSPPPATLSQPPPYSSQSPPPYSSQSPPPYSALSQNTGPIDDQGQSLDITRKKQSAIMDDIERRKKSSIHSSKTEEKDTPSSMASRINRRRRRNIDPLQDNITSRPLTTPNSTTGTRRKNQKPVPTAGKTRKKKQKLRFADEDSGRDPLVRRKDYDPSDSPTSINTPSTPSSGKNDGFREVMIRIQDASFGSGLKPAITTVDRTGRTARGALREISIASEGKATVR